MDELVIDMPIEEVNDDKKILIAKKFILSRRVLAKVIENLGYDYDILDEIDTLEDALASNHYDILFTDVKLGQ